MANILSLFDGMSCGMLAMMGAGVEVENYYAYEIDKYAIQTSQHNFPKIKQCGDVFKGDYTQYEGIDYLIGGSVCTYWSIAQSPDKRETTASGLGWELFSQYVRALHEAKPKYFIYENNKSMSKEIRKSITETFGFEDICINSALLSAQNRQRLYWVGKRNDDGTYSKVDVEQPEDRGILLRDALDGIAFKDKQNCIDANYYKGGNYSNPKKQSGQRMCVAEPVGVTKSEKSYCLTQGYSNGSGENIGNYVTHTLKKGCKSMVAEPVNVTAEGKSQCLRATCYKDTVRNIVGNDIDKKTGVAEPVACRCRGRKDENGNGYAKYECREDNKSNTLDTNSVNGSMVAEPVNTTDDNKSQTIKAQYANTDVNNICKYSSTYGASGVAEPVAFSMVGDLNNRKVGTKYKAYCLAANPSSDMTARVIEPVSCRCRGRKDENGNSYAKYECRIDCKSNTLDTNSTNGNMVAEPVTNSSQVGALPRPNGELSTSQAFRIYDTNAKSVTLKAGGGGAGGKTGLYAIPVEFEDGIPTKAISYADGKTYKVYEVKEGQITIKQKQYPIKLQDGYYIIRKLTVSECKRLQTVPEWFEFPISDTQAYRQLGNGWTVDVITHLIQATLKDKEIRTVK